MKRRTFLTTAGLATAAVTVPTATVAALSARPKQAETPPTPKKADLPPPKRFESFYSTTIGPLGDLCEGCRVQACLHCGRHSCATARTEHCPSHPVLPVTLFRLTNIRESIKSRLSKLVHAHAKAIQWLRCEQDGFLDSSRKHVHADAIASADRLVAFANIHNLGVYWCRSDPRSHPRFYPLKENTNTSWLAREISPDPSITTSRTPSISISPKT